MYPHATVHVSSHNSASVLTHQCMCPHATVHVSSRIIFLLRYFRKDPNYTSFQDFRMKDHIQRIRIIKTYEARYSELYDTVQNEEMWVQNEVEGDDNIDPEESPEEASVNAAEETPSFVYDSEDDSFIPAAEAAARKKKKEAEQKTKKTKKTKRVVTHGITPRRAPTYGMAPRRDRAIAAARRSARPGSSDEDKVRESSRINAYVLTNKCVCPHSKSHASLCVLMNVSSR